MTKKPHPAFRTALLVALCAVMPAAFSLSAKAQAVTKKLHILVINGPNLDILGKRQPEIYGHTTLADIQKAMSEKAATLNTELIFVQSNSEGPIIDALHQHWDDVDAAIVNTAGYSQNSVAIHDAIEAVPYPTFEIHISNIAARDTVHQADVIMPVVKAAVLGWGWRGYLLVLQGAVDFLRDGGKK
jgi:3-dehydroquinate dehydratase-2